MNRSAPLGGQRVAILVLVAAASMAVPFALARDTEPTGSSGVDSQECPEANAELEAIGAPIPDEYGSSCPDPKELAEAIESSSQRATPALEAMRAALDAGVIREDQAPGSYPEPLKDAIGLDK